MKPHEQPKNQPTEQEDEPEPVFGDVVFRYTRAQAIEDGVLVDVTPTARECGFRLPVAVTQGVWCDCVAVPPQSRG